MSSPPRAPARGAPAQKAHRMSMFDNLKDQALNLAKEHKDVVENVAEQAAEKIGDAVDGVTGGKFSDQVDAVQQQAPDQISKLLGN
jgi:hypothetical protein